MELWNTYKPGGCLLYVGDVSNISFLVLKVSVVVEYETFPLEDTRNKLSWFNYDQNAFGQMKKKFQSSTSVFVLRRCKHL